MGFFDQVIAGVDKGVSSAKEGSKTMVEKSRIRTQITDIEKQKNELLLNMGNLVYNLHTSGEISIEQCSGLCEEIGRLNRQTEQLKADLAALDNPKPQAYAEQSVIVNGVQCKDCGHMNKEGAKFCAGCGHPLV